MPSALAELQKRVYMVEAIVEQKEDENTEFNGGRKDEVNGGSMEKADGIFASKFSVFTEMDAVDIKPNF